MSAHRQAFTLLEIVLALALLAGALAALGEVLRLARLNAENAAAETQAQFVASSVLAELMSGAREPVDVAQAVYPLEVDPPWLYSIAMSASPYSELLLLEVKVEQQLPSRKQPISLTLRRWVLNPEYADQLMTASQTAAQGVGQAQGGF
jgi:prepilin-type N-terminal cleavage/methylation domain-containing protein